MPNGYTYFDALNMSRDLYGLSPLQVTAGAAYAGYAVANDFGLAETVGGGTALICGGSLALKGGKKLLWDAPKWAYQNYGNYRQGFGTLVSNYKQGISDSRELSRALKGNNFFQTVGNRMQYNRLAQLEAGIPQKPVYDIQYYRQLQQTDPAKAKAYFEQFTTTKAKNAKAKANCYKEAQAKIKSIKERVKSGKLKGAALKKEIGELEGLIQKGNTEVEALVKSGKIKPGSKLAQFGAKLKAGLKKVTGVDAAGKALAKGAKSSSKVVSTTCKGISKGAKAFVKGGGAVTAAVEFAFEVPDIVQTFRECGSGAGWKQVGKAATVAVASGVGYAAGAWAGGKIGAVAGAAIGSCVPVIGNAVGAVVGGIIGVACGLFGSWLCSKGAKALVGKSELEKKKEQESRQAAVDAYNDPKKMEELVNAYEQMINERDQMVQEGIEDEQIACPQDNTYVAQSELDTELARLSYSA